MMESSEFHNQQFNDDAAELLERHGATCDTFRVKLYGKLHFLKRLKAEYANDILFQEAFHKEFETGYRLEHPNLVRYISLSSDGILIEYVDGETLTDCLTNRPQYFTRKNTKKFVSQLLDVVRYLHAHQVLHLDIKPDNILLTRINDDVKLVDFGCCYTDTFSDTQGHTNGFAAPEQLRGEVVDERTDIYAIGKILAMLPHAYIYNKVIARCTASNPSDRYQSIDDLQHDLSHRRWYPYLLLLAIPVVAIALLFYPQQQTAHEEILPVATDTIPSVKMPEKADTPHITKTSVIETPLAPTKPQVSDTPSGHAKQKSIEQLRSDIKRLVLPVFQSTLGSVEHPRQNDSLWMIQSRIFLAGEQQRLDQIVRSHPEFSMDTVVTEYRNYVQLLIIEAANK
ncbi:MAG: serine/threonine protein kinase [Prevotella sp.]|nr:serine/threonine protein kinase [Prevotella sp.]